MRRPRPAPDLVGLRWLARIGLDHLDREWLKIFSHHAGGSDAAWASVEAEPTYIKLVADIARARKVLGLKPEPVKQEDA